MIAPLIAQQNAINASNLATMQMMRNCDAMLSFGNSQPLRPSFAAQADVFELQNKANETKLAVANSMYEAAEKAKEAGIKRSTPNYGGKLNYYA